MNVFRGLSLQARHRDAQTEYDEHAIQHIFVILCVAHVAVAPLRFEDGVAGVYRAEIVKQAP